MELSQLLLVFLIFAKIGNAALTLRVRLPSGIIQRISVDNEKEETIESIRRTMLDRGFIPTNSTIAIKSVEYDCANASKNETRIADLGMAQGEIITVVSDVIAKTTTSAKHDGSYATTAKSTGSTKSKSKKAGTLAEVIAAKKEMIKVARQKSTGKIVVAVALSVGKIMTRLSKGGVALLIGRTLVEPTRDSSPSKAQVTSGAKRESRECVEVHAACEIFSGSQFPTDWTAPSSVVSIGLVAHVAERLGLSIVGCGIGIANKEKAKNSCMWSPQHVITALQLRPLAKGGRFVVLSAAPESPPSAAIGKTKGNPAISKRIGGKSLSLGAAGGKEAKEGDAAGAAKKTIRRRKGGGVDAKVKAATPGVTQEAFELSNQSIMMHEKQMLPNRVDPEQSGDSKKSKIKSLKRGPGKGKGKDGSYEEIEGEKLVLASPVLVANSAETKEIDPLLLAVPMPIVALGSGSAAPTKQKGKTAAISLPWKPAPLGITFEHSFPTAYEMLENSVIRQKAEKHVLRVLGTVTDPATVARLRDVQLLHHLSKLLDTETMSSLCETLAVPGKALPHMVLVSMEMIKLSLGAGAGDDDL